MKALLVIAACALLVACGGDQSDTPILLSVYFGGSQANGPLRTRSDGLVAAGGDVGLYSGLMRASASSVTLADGSVIDIGPASFDLLNGSVVYEQQVASEPQSITMQFDVPPQHSGVLPGEEVCAFLGGLIDDHQLEYRDNSAPSITLQVPAGEPSGRVSVNFDLDNWFDNIDTQGLSGSDHPYRIDENDNPSLAVEVEQRIYYSARICSTCDSDQ